MTLYIVLLIIVFIIFFVFWKLMGDTNKSKEEIQMDKSFEEWNNRKIYKILTSEIIDSISDDNLEQTLFDNIYEIIGNDYKNELTNIQKLSKGQQAFWSTWILEGEVNNGGYNQFYFNSSGQYANMAEIGFKTIGAEKYANLTSRANKIYAENKVRLAEFDDGTMESFSESYKDNPLNNLDDEFYELENIESVSYLRIKYIREHIKEFTTQ
ncbi:DMP19 family protein [Flavivirga aquimarina]|uniref:DMP19 family protein n=1 Tax=Flavivirga aquimarina TaxID=2027862 RepID=A0ABT8W912_9FLAO|nr:DMP19 family protein [Flavivirga aquimarina]MDO5969618.1 DMP19 family protein [Flavivirga aquimarina]